jgi:hypothetical protein
MSQMATGELTLDSLAPERRAELLDAFRDWRAQQTTTEG